MSNRFISCVLLVTVYILLGVKLDGMSFTFLIAGVYYLLGYIGSNINK